MNANSLGVWRAVFDVVKQSQQTHLIIGQSYVTATLCAVAIVCYSRCLLNANVCYCALPKMSTCRTSFLKETKHKNMDQPINIHIVRHSFWETSIYHASLSHPQLLITLEYLSIFAVQKEWTPHGSGFCCRLIFQLPARCTPCGPLCSILSENKKVINPFVCKTSLRLLSRAFRAFQIRWLLCTSTFLYSVSINLHCEHVRVQCNSRLSTRQNTHMFKKLCATVTCLQTKHHLHVHVRACTNREYITPDRN